MNPQLLMSAYQPPFCITPCIIDLISQISESLGCFRNFSDEKTLKLRRINRIRTIHGSLAIEGNTLSEEQITAVLDGKHVIAPPREILEVRNAIIAYDTLSQWNPCLEQNLLEAHQLLMHGLIEDAGRYRQSGVGVMSGNTVIHMAPPAKRLQALMEDLLLWIKKTDHHPLIVAAVFHYEFEFIHPFADGNGRMGRLWQTLILSHWKKIFANFPVESFILEHQTAYYQALQHATEQSDSACFIEFILEQILSTLISSTSDFTPQVTPQVTPQARKLRRYCKKPRSRKEMQDYIEIKDREHFRKRILKPLLDAGLLEATIPDQATHPKQKYFAPSRK